MPEIDACFGALRASFRVSENDEPLAKELYTRLKDRFSEVSRQLPEATDTLRLAMMLFELEEELADASGELRKARERLASANATLNDALTPKEHIGVETETSLRTATDRIERLAKKLRTGL